MLGLVSQSYQLYLEAKKGRMRALGPEHRSFKYSSAGAEKVWRHIVMHSIGRILPSMDGSNIHGWQELS